ncbi:MAG: hypothetical protein ACXVXP_15910, partial [Mycobacteriaceae bacterium]
LLGGHPGRPLLLELVGQGLAFLVQRVGLASGLLGRSGLSQRPGMVRIQGFPSQKGRSLKPIKTSPSSRSSQGTSPRIGGGSRRIIEIDPRTSSTLRSFRAIKR